MGCVEYEGTVTSDGNADLLSLGDDDVILLGAYFAIALCILQASIYLIHLVQMAHIKEDPRRRSVTNGEKQTCCQRITSGLKAVYDDCTSGISRYEKDRVERTHAEYEVEGNIFNEKLMISPTMSEYSTNTMRGNQTLLAVCLSTAISLSLMIGFNRLLLTHEITHEESVLHIVVSASYLSLVFVGIFPSSQIHSTDNEGSVRRRDYNMILCCGWKSLGTSAVLHVLGSLTYLFIPVGVKLYTNRDGGDRCYAKRHTFQKLLWTALALNVFFVLLHIIRPQGCGCLNFSGACKSASKWNCCKRRCACWEPKLNFFADCWSQTSPANSKNETSTDAPPDTRCVRKYSFMFVYFIELLSFGFTTFTYFYVEMFTFFSYKQDRLITPRFVRT
eukprot:m.600952 g.600952  ORF g.600952 m.600952 type:complete len:389 (+) comp22436_c0_seq13:108-1274(+)